METPNPRLHAALIKAWADGYVIQRFDGSNWRNEKHPSWDADEEYRVRPDGAPWHPEYKDKYFIVDENFEPSEEVWDDCDFDDEQYERGNCFRTLEEAEAAAERVKAALKGEELSEGEKALRLSDGEKALIKALRETMIVCAWRHDEVAIVDKELKTRHDCVSFLTTGSLASDDKIRDALNAISLEQDVAIEQAEQEACDE